MKTCPKCNAQIEDDALFCMYCGAKIDATQTKTKVCSNCGAEIPIEANFCPECSANQQDEEIVTNLYDGVEPREFVFQCLYGCNVQPNYAGELTINPLVLQFKSDSKGFMGVMTTIANWGMKENLSIKIKDITHMSIMERGYCLYVRTSDGSTHVFAGPYALRLRRNKLLVKGLAYIIELYRRMYWYYGEYQEGKLCYTIPCVGWFEKAVQRLDHDYLSDDELIKFVKNI